MGVAVSSPNIRGVNSATLDTAIQSGDYRLLTFDSFHFLPFHPDQKEISFVFCLFGDNTAEGTEAFQAVILTVYLGEAPTYQNPTTASQTTTIRILDNDRKLKILKCMAIVLSQSICIVFVVGFEEPMYTLSESAGSQEVCVLVSNPPQEQPLGMDIILVASTSTEGTTAGIIKISIYVDRLDI